MSGKRMSLGKHNSATARLKQDYIRLKRDPVPLVIAEPLPSNILEWHYVVTGPENTPYEGGLYHGKLVFPREFPFKPPSIFMITPNGRFKTNTRLCLSISDFHPDTWNPAWSVSTILTGLLSFMTEKSPTLGSIEASDFERRSLARQSVFTNMQNQEFCELFPELVDSIKNKIDLHKQSEEALRSGSTDTHSRGNDGLPFQNNLIGHQNAPQSMFANICIFIGVAAFAYTVKYVLRSVGTD